MYYFKHFLHFWVWSPPYPLPLPPPPHILPFNICLYFHFIKGPEDAPFEKSSANKPKFLNYSYMFLEDTEFMHVFALKMIKKLNFREKSTFKFYCYSVLAVFELMTCVTNRLKQYTIALHTDRNTYSCYKRKLRKVANHCQLILY